MNYLLPQLAPVSRSSLTSPTAPAVSATAISEAGAPPRALPSSPSSSQPCPASPSCSQPQGMCRACLSQMHTEPLTDRTQTRRLPITIINSGFSFPGGLQRRRPGFDPWVGKSPGEGHGNLLQYSCLGNPMDTGAWWATVHGVAKSRTRLSD